MAFVGMLLNALIAIPQIASYVEKLVNAIVLWQIARQKEETLAKIADAAWFAARAQTDEERFQASEKWCQALSQPRINAKP